MYEIVRNITEGARERKIDSDGGRGQRNHN